MIIWTKPSGMEIETNDMAATVAYCEGLGWKRAGDSGDAADEPDPGTDGASDIIGATADEISAIQENVPSGTDDDGLQVATDGVFDPVPADDVAAAD